MKEYFRSLRRPPLGLVDAVCLHLEEVSDDREGFLKGDCRVAWKDCMRQCVDEESGYFGAVLKERTSQRSPRSDDNDANLNVPVGWGSS